MVERGTALKLGAAAVLLVAAAGGLYLYQLGSSYQQPQVQSIDNEFGAVTAETTAVRSAIVVRNPNDDTLPGSAQIRYEVRMNTVTVAEGTKRGVRLRPGLNRLNMTAQLDNGKIPAWWVTHVENGERTELTISPRVSVTGVPIGSKLPDQTRAIRTDLLGAFTAAEPREVTLGDRSVLVVSNQTARWGDATADQTPIVVTSTVRNTHDEPVRLDGTTYRIEMNDVRVGNGTTGDGLVVQPGETTTYTVRSYIDTPRMEAWWASHVRNDESTELTVSVYGVVEQDGERKRVPISVFERRAAIRSDFLGENNTTVEALAPPGDGVAFEEPTLSESESEWGAVRDETTDVETDLVVDNPNGGDIGDLIRLRIRQTTAINGVPVADGETAAGPLDAGGNPISLTSEFRHSTVPAWWARHLNGGERSEVVTESATTVDVGATTVDAGTDDRERSLETDLLADFNDSTDEPVEQDGQRVATIRETRATWGTATEETAPIESAVTVRNEQTRPITIEDITYTIRLNDVVLAANRTVDEQYEIAPLSTRTIEPTFLLDNSKMAAWWPTHVRNGESSVLRTDVYLTVTSPFGEKRVRLDSFSGNRTVTTDVFSSSD